METTNKGLLCLQVDRPVGSGYRAGNVVRATFKRTRTRRIDTALARLTAHVEFGL